MSVTFDVSPVSCSQERLPSRSLYDALEYILHNEREHLFYGEGQRELQIIPCLHHPFLFTIDRAFSYHLPLSISPDMIWTLILQGLSTHIQLDPEKYRSRLVSHQGTLSLLVQRDDLLIEAPSLPWSEVIASFATQIREHLGKKYDFFVPSFSTTGPNERTAYHVALMNTVQSFFEYPLITLCGIPQITLEGTPEDWADLHDRLAYLSEFDLEDWATQMSPIIRGFSSAMQGDHPTEHWRDIYKSLDESGGPYVSGWINVFFPYLRTSRGEIYPNESMRRWKERWQQEKIGPKLGDFPSGLCKVPFQWRYYASDFSMELFSGFLGFKQCQESFHLRPEIGYLVTRKRQETPSPQTSKTKNKASKIRD